MYLLEKADIPYEFAYPGWEQRETFDSVWEWLRYAINVMIEREKIEMMKY